MNSLDLLRGFNATVGRVAPRHVADRARRRFMTPRDTTPRDWELPWLERAERITLRFGLSALRWGSGPTVLLMHGWEGRPTQFASLIDALVQAGYGVIALDAPAHGRSPGREANIVLFARALLEAAEDLPPLYGVIGHSMGGASAMLAIQLGLRPRALVTVAAPSRILGMLRGFARFIGLPPRAGEQFIKRVEDHAGIPAADLDVQHYRLDMPGLVAHAEDDPLVPAVEAGRIHEAWLGSQLLRLEGGGHQRVLADPRLVKAVLQLFHEVGLRASA